MKLHTVAFTLVIVGALNWGLIGLGNYMDKNWDVVNLLLGSMPAIQNLIYFLVGISGIVLLAGHKKGCRECNPSGAM